MGVCVVFFTVRQFVLNEVSVHVIRWEVNSKLMSQRAAGGGDRRAVMNGL